MLLGTLGASLLGNMQASKGILRNLEMKKYYHDEPRFNGAFSRDNLPDKIKDGTYIINLDQYSNIGTYWITFYALNNKVTYFDNFGVEHIPKKI